MKSNAKKRLTLITLLLTVAIFTLSIYIGSQPEKYNLSIGDVSDYDIVAPRAIADSVETQKRAAQAQADIQTVMMRSEQTSSAVISDVTRFLDIVQERREAIYKVQSPDTEVPDSDGNNARGEPTNETQQEPSTNLRQPTETEFQLSASSLISGLDQTLGLTLPAADAQQLMKMSEVRFNNFSEVLLTQTEAIMADSLDQARLAIAINDAAENLKDNSEYYVDDVTLIGQTLQLILKPNVVPNEEATINARKAAYDRVINNPVMVNRGTRIVSKGDMITEANWQMLLDLDLTGQTGIDWFRLLGILLLVIILAGLAVLYFQRYHPNIADTPRTLMALSLALLIPMVTSIYLAQHNPLTPPVYFAAVVIAAYFGFRTATVMSILLIIMLIPMTGFEMAFPMTALAGCLVASLYTKGIGRHDNYAKIIVSTAVVTLSMSAVFGLLAHEPLDRMLTHILQAVLSGMFSVVVAIGVMPIFEMLFNTVSPLRLIELSQTSHPLLRRLFIEAPGTSQHSMMVANLAEAAAEAVGANAMIVRVGSYFHDIGKLENPLAFTENQSGDNPHDFMLPQESCKLITRHPEDGVKLGRKHRLPQPVLNIILQHHGTTVLQYFYHKACNIAEKEGKPLPSPESYSYPTPVPNSEESAIVMLADSVEAAMRSVSPKNLQEAESMIRRVVKTKTDQNQLIKSGLSFAQVESIIKSFLHVYAGHFHQRVSYPTDRVVVEAN
ncbi:MAG: HD family phosphohydrolase [Saccharofermentanales bacterium]|jgi:putative nucleotidyltransferase with HDIG domain|nr:HDIG domain-containing protein [Bacillota bacterium]NLB09102.1 HDIG domain-containing protein [Clostridiales bacterium]